VVRWSGVDLTLLFVRRYDRRNSRAKKRRAKDEAEGGDITYINDRNKVFNKKINKFFDKYTSEYVMFTFFSGVQVLMMDLR
jgi:hypothetical protein